MRNQRPCTCDRFTPGQDYLPGIDCRQCWLFHNSSGCNKYWGGTGITGVCKVRKLKKIQSKTVGPGTKLKELLASLGFKEEPGCPCKAHAKQMDAWGCDECEKRIDEIVGWLRAEATRQGKFFADFAAKMLVMRAIQQSRASVPKAATLTADVPPWEIVPLLMVEKKPRFPPEAKHWPNFQEALEQAKHRFTHRPWWAELET